LDSTSASNKFYQPVCGHPPSLVSGSITYFACFLTALLARGAATSASDALHPRQIICVVLGLIWCCRLGYFLFRRVMREGKDHRFDEIKNNPWSLLGAFGAQITWIWFTGSFCFYFILFHACCPGFLFDRTWVHEDSPCALLPI
jgi:hypothetical protein